MKFPFDALQLAIFARLSGDANVSCPVFDWPVSPEEQATPYIVIGEFFSEDTSVKSTSAQTVTSEINVWSRSLGMREVNDIMDEIAQSITGSDLDITGSGFDYFPLRVEAEANRTYFADELFRHGLIKFVDLISERED